MIIYVASLSGKLPLLVQVQKREWVGMTIKATGNSSLDQISEGARNNSHQEMHLEVPLQMLDCHTLSNEANPSEQRTAKFIKGIPLVT